MENPKSLTSESKNKKKKKRVFSCRPFKILCVSLGAEEQAV